MKCRESAMRAVTYWKRSYAAVRTVNTVKAAAQNRKVSHELNQSADAVFTAVYKRGSRPKVGQRRFRTKRVGGCQVVGDDSGRA